MGLHLEFEAGAVIVAGGSGGIGEAIALAFAKAGMPVVITYHSNEAKAAAIKAAIEAAGGRCECHRVDLADVAQVNALFADMTSRHGRIADVVYAAGPHFDFNFIGAIPDEQWHHVVNADINGAFHLIQGAVRVFRKQGDGGNLVAVITSAIERVPIADIMSAAPKAAIQMLMRGVAKEAGRFNIRANCVGPGWINAGLGKKGLEEKLDEKSREAIRTKTIPLQRFGEADDIANAVLFLCSRQASFITGQSLAVDGGLQL
ncbi:SDR family NAD(P)-dependent oxidoreductase [Hydrocarboniphaga sp.]|uniref:SDR family NAD(P)-dependent oxidoreductase n=1 Tax=Hydrocarboniphaga sp. TaxID=2033016 RepID=UPI003D0FCAFD